LVVTVVSEENCASFFRAQDCEWGGMLRPLEMEELHTKRP